jgi:phage terminase small subunit
MVETDTKELKTQDTGLKPKNKKSHNSAVKPKQKKHLDRLTIKEQTFAKEYIANRGNGTKAALLSYDTVDKNTAANIASTNLMKPKIQTAIEALAESQGIGLQVRMQEAARIALGTKEVEVTTYDKDDNIISRTHRLPTPKEQLSAIELVNKTTGLYKQQDIEASTAKHEIDKRYREAMKAIEV